MIPVLLLLLNVRYLWKDATVAQLLCAQQFPPVSTRFHPFPPSHDALQLWNIHNLQMFFHLILLQKTGALLPPPPVTICQQLWEVLLVCCARCVGVSTSLRHSCCDYFCPFCHFTVLVTAIPLHFICSILVLRKKERQTNRKLLGRDDCSTLSLLLLLLQWLLHIVAVVLCFCWLPLHVATSVTHYLLYNSCCCWL